MYAVGQGALAVECREDDQDVLALLQPLVDRDTVLAILAERSFLKELGGGCFAPVAVRSSLVENTLSLRGQVCSVDGSEIIEEGQKCVLNEKCSNGADKGHKYDESGEPLQ